MNDVSCGVISFLHFVTINAFADGHTDGRKDGQKGRSNTMRCVTCSRKVNKRDTADVLIVDHVAGMLELSSVHYIY